MSNVKKKIGANSPVSHNRTLLFQNPDALNNVINCITDVVMPSDQCNSLDKLILIRLMLQGGLTKETNTEIAAVFNKDPITISKRISKLESTGFIASSGLSSRRTLSINDSTDIALYNYTYSIFFSNKDNNNNIIINKTPLAFPLRANQIHGIVKIICNDYYMYDPVKICEEFSLISANEWRNKIKPSSIGVAIRRTLLQLLSENRLVLDTNDPDPDHFKCALAKGLIQLFSVKTLIKPTSIIVEQKREERQPMAEESLRDRNERRLQKYLNTLWDEKLIEIKSDKSLQKSSIGEFVKVKAHVKGCYVRGIQSMCNYNLELDNGDILHAVIVNTEYKGREKECEDFDGKYIQFEGKVVYNRYHNRHTIQSVSGQFPVLLLESNDLDTNLNLHGFEDNDLKC